MTGRGDRTARAVVALSGGVLLAGGVLLTGCAATIAGRPAPRPTPAAAAASVPPAAAPTTAAPTTSFPTRGGHLDCRGADVVAPAGAPYCFAAPAGLPAIDLGPPTAGAEGSFRMSFGLGATDHVDVQAYDVGTDTGALDDRQVTDQLGGVVASLESGGFDFTDAPSKVAVDGARAFSYAGTSTDGRQRIVATFVFRGSTEVQVNCAVTDRGDLIDAACASVLQTMQITG